MNKPFNLTNREYSILKKIEEKPNITLEQICLEKDLDYPKLRDLIYFIKHKLIKKVKERNKEDYFIITPKGEEELKRKQLNLDIKNTVREKPEKKPKHISKKEKHKAMLRDISKQKREKTQDSEQEKQGNWLEWTSPIYVEEEKRWEFYKKQGETILEIYHSESEEEIKEQHQSKVMSHIMASIQEDSPKKKDKAKPTLILSQPQPHISIKRENTSTYLHEEAITTIIRLRLEGMSYNEILFNINSTFGLAPTTIGLYHTQALDQIKERAKGIINETLKLHFERYEQLYQWFRENKYPKIAAKILERKERLIGLHDGEQVNQILLDDLAKITNDKGRYDWSLLSIKEKETLMGFMKRSVKVNPIKKEE